MKDIIYLSVIALLLTMPTGHAGLDLSTDRPFGVEEHNWIAITDHAGIVIESMELGSMADTVIVEGEEIDPAQVRVDVIEGTLMVRQHGRWMKVHTPGQAAQFRYIR